MMCSTVSKLFAVVLILFGVMRISQAGEIYILYTANISGSIENCSCESHPGGGMDRLKPFTDDFKQRHPGSILVDGGDFFNPYPYPELNNAMLKVLGMMQYDVLVPGEHEFTVNKSQLSQYLAQYSEKILISNSVMNGRHFRQFPAGDITINMYSYLDPGVFQFIPEPDTLKLSGTQYQVRQKTDKNVFNILIYHGKIGRLDKILAGHVPADLVLLAHEQNRGQSENSGIKVIGVGRDGESVAVIHIMKKSDGLNADVQIKSIDRSIAADQDLLPIIDDYKLTTRTK